MHITKQAWPPLQSTASGAVAVAQRGDGCLSINDLGRWDTSVWPFLLVSLCSRRSEWAAAIHTSR